MMRFQFKRVLSFVVALAMVLSMVPVLQIAVHATDLSGWSNANIGISYENSSSDSSWKYENGVITGKTAGRISNNKSTLTITNTSGKDGAVLSLTFNWTLTDTSGTRGIVEVNGTEYLDKTGDGTCTATLNAGDAVTVYIQSGTSFTAAQSTQINITAISLALPDTGIDTTFQAPDYGSYTVSDGTTTSTVSAGDQALVVNNAATVGYTLTANVPSGYKFVNWYDVTNGGEISTANPLTGKTFTEATTVKAVIVPDATAVFGVGTATSATYQDGYTIVGATTATYYTVSVMQHFTDLNEAAAYAQSSGSKYIVLTSSGTLPAGTYTIPAGVTLLIPFDDANTLYTTTPCSTGTYATPTAYRTLTMENGANLVVNGALSVSGKHMRAAAGQMNGAAPTGKQGFISMLDGSNIVVNDGGALYAYGYITGEGNVVAQSGATVYELFQIGDFRGGTQTTTEMLDNEQKVFFFSQYYVQNIEVPLTLYAGATEYSFTTIYMNSAAISSSVAFIGGSGCMFTMTDGYVVKTYDGSKDRLVLDSYSNVSLSPISLVVAGKDINTSAYVLPINGNISVNAHTGNISIAQDIALLPGAEINIGAGATSTINSGVSVYVYDASSWSTYCWGNISGTQQNVNFVPVKYAPGQTYTRTAADLVDAKIHVAGTLDATAGYLYTTGDGAAITGEAGAVVKMNAVADSVTYQILMNLGDTSAYTDTNLYVVKSADSDVYVKIAAVSAKLQHGDGTYLATAGAAAGTTYNYCADCDSWYTGTHKFEITWVGATADLGTEEYCKGAVPTYKGTTPTKAQSGCTTYTFAGWSNAADGTALTALPAVTGEASYYAIFTEGISHTPGADATCTTDQTCTVCGEVLTEKLGHTPGADATCTTDQTCTVCGEVLTEKLGHTPGADATCTTDQTCTVCGEVLTEKLGHTPGADATCTTDQTCTVCGEVLTEKLGHTPGADATCTTDQTCTVCGEVLTEKLGHTPGVDATCTTDQTCTVCGDVLTEATGHGAAVTYTNNGDTHSATYDCCGETYVTGEAHEYVEGICACGAEEPAATGLKGDVTLDGVVDMDDAVALLKHVLMAEVITDATALANGEVTNDGSLDMDDPVKLMQYVLKAIDSLD